ncbi:uncharacterized protein LOC110974883 [Acanthaster planci]|uniref:Uncharacterized protein LOC110974883 n=1 Tax=Acanthaster planci TaxID=133434 RepID=A0A8B7XQQ9_ACAPL|nr:uncharacterized protein LOC110974883 [Acanthaster planci]
MAHSEQSIVEMGIKKDLDYIIDDLKTNPQGERKTQKTVRGVTSTSVIRHNVGSVGGGQSTTRKSRNPCRLNAKELNSLESKATAALHVIRQASISMEQLQKSRMPSHPSDSPMTVSSLSPNPKRNVLRDFSPSAADSASSPTLSRKKKHCHSIAEKRISKKGKKSKSNHEDRYIFKEDEDWIQGIEVRRASPHRALVSSVSESVSPDFGRRRSRHIDDLLSSNSPLETQKVTSKLKSKSLKSKRTLDRVTLKPRSGLEKSPTESDPESNMKANSAEKSEKELQQLDAKLDITVQKSAEPTCNNSRGTRTTLDNEDSASGENKIITCTLDFLVSQKEVEDLRKENESLKKQLEEAADWEMQVMRAYKTLAEKHHHASRSEEALVGNHIIQEVPSRQPHASCVTDHADFELLHQTASNLQGTGKPDHHGSASPISDDEKQLDPELSTPLDISSDPLMIRRDHKQENGAWGVSASKPRDTPLKPNLVKSQSSPLEYKMASSTFPPLSRKHTTSITTKQPVNDCGYRVVSAVRVNVEEDKLSDVSSIYEQFEISGDRHDMRFPWQHDVYVQCDPMETRDVSIQTDFEPCSECQLRGFSNSSDLSELDLASNCSFDMRTRSSVISSSRRPTGKAKPKLQRQNFSLDLNDYPEFFNSSLQVNGTVPSGTPQRPFRSRTCRISSLRPLSDSDISRRLGENVLGQHKIFQRRKNADVASTKSGITMHLTIDTSERDSLPCSPCPSPIPQEFENSLHFKSRPKVIVTHHDDPAYDVQSLRSSSNGSQDSLTSESSSLRVPSPEFLQSKAVFKKDNSIVSGSSDTEDNEPSSLPPTSRIHQRRGAVISQIPPNSSDCGDEDGGGSGISCLHDSGQGGTNSPPHHGDLLFPPNFGNEHRCSIMSTASSTLASVAAVHLHDFIEASATAGFDSNDLEQDNNDSAENKKKLHALFKKKFGKDKDKSMIDDITTVFTNFKIRDQDDLEFSTYKDKHWRDVIMEIENNNSNHTVYSPPQDEVKRRDKVWELFRSECVYLIEHILVLKNVFQEPLRALQCEGYLMYIEPAKIFANLDELSQVSASFCRDLIRMLLAKASRTEICHTDAVVSAFSMFGNRVCPAYQRYCMNYSAALHYIENLKKHEDFVEFVKLCEQDTRCKRLQLADLMVAPIQHVTKYPLLLKDIRERTNDLTERASLNATLQAVEVALNELDGKVKWLGNFERLRELQQMITWPQVEELDPKVSVPEFLKDVVAKMSKSNLLASTKRTLLHEGPLTLIDGTKSSDMYVFLFDDMLLISKIRKNNVKKKSLPDGVTIAATPPVPRKKDGFSFTVYRPPIPLDRVSVVEIESKRAAASGLKHGFVLLQSSRYQQFAGAYTLAASDDNSKQIWLTHLKNAREKWIQMLRNNEGDDFANDDIRRDRKRTL